MVKRTQGASPLAESKLISRGEAVTNILKNTYPDAICSLEWEGEPWRLLVMGRLSAQCTDAKVNIVCRELFSVFPTANALAEGDLDAIEKIIRPCGLYKVKAKNIKDECALLVSEYGGILPDSMDELLKFPGVGRKIANLILGDIYKIPGIVADTHCIRICGRLGFYPEEMKDPFKVEKIMGKYIQPEEQSDFCHRIVLFGREFCKSQRPLCEGCPLSLHCERNKKQ